MSKIQKSQIKEAIQVLKSGGVIVFPTETSYGLGCDATNAKAVKRVFEIKGRDARKGTPLIVDSLKTAKQCGVFSKTAESLAKAHWPGALTLVLPFRLGGTPPIISACLQDKNIALRVSSNPIALALAKGLGRPLVATSANQSGEPACFTVTCAKLVRSDYFVSGGTLRRRRASTLVRVITEQIEILRKGPVHL